MNPHAVGGSGAKRSTGIDVNFRNFWCTPPALLRILRDLFSLHAERFCNPLNFSPLFGKATTGNIDDKFWGFDFDAMMADWTATFGYMNPEFTDDLMVECIIKARQAATLTTDRPVRNIAVIPFHADCPQTFAKLSEYHHTQKILITFQPDTFSFWPYQVHLGTRSPFGFTPYKRTLAIVLWENQLAREKFPLSHTHQGELASWCAENLKAHFQISPSISQLTIPRKQSIPKPTHDKNTFTPGMAKDRLQHPQTIKRPISTGHKPPHISGWTPISPNPRHHGSHNP